MRITASITKRDSASLDKYLNDISRIRLLTIDEEVQLCIKIKQGDPLAIEKLVKSNLRFVVSVAKQYQHKGLSLGDLINEGNIGLIKSASKFDETKGFRFISFAVYWIKQSVMQAITEQTRTVKLPFNQVYGISKTNKTSSKLEQELQRTPTSAEISEYLGLEEWKVKDYYNNAKRSVSLDSLVNVDGEKCLIDIIKNDSPDPDDQMVRGSLTDNLLHLLNTLPKREAEIMTLYLGIGEPYALQLEDIAIIFNLSKERVRQIKDKALKELRRRGKPYLSKLGIYNSEI
ncbi:MAG: polymerase sigma factor rpoD [Pedobacter sp.]|nr:polymerase sigma factor rpoD [Pedobacter sp.]